MTGSNILIYSILVITGIIAGYIVRILIQGVTSKTAGKKASAIIDEGVNCLLEHPLLVAYDNFW